MKKLDKDKTYTAFTKDFVMKSVYQNNPDAFYDQYAELHDWVMNSLDGFRSELLSMCFPIFAVCFKELMNRKRIDKANELFETYGTHFATREPQGYEEMNAARKSVKATTDSEYLDVCTSRRHLVLLSPYAYELVQLFLDRKMLFLLICVIFEHIKLRVTECASSSLMWRPMVPDIERVDEQLFVCRLASDSYSLQWNVKSDRSVSASGYNSRNDSVEQLSRSSLPSAATFTVLNGKSVGVTDVAVSRDGAFFAAGTETSTIRTWHLYAKSNKNSDGDKGSKGTTKEMVEQELVGHSNTVYSVDFSPSELSPHGQCLLLSASGDRTVRLWVSSSSGHSATSTSNHWQEARVFKGHTRAVWDVSFSRAVKHSSFYFATASADRTACLWTIDRSYPVRVFSGHVSDVDSVCIHPNGDMMASGTCNGDVHIWDVRTTRRRHQHVALTRSCVDAVQSIAFAPEGRFMAVGGADSNIVVWDLAMMTRPISVFRGHEDAVHALDFDCGGSLLASGSADTTVKLWDMSTLNQTRPGNEMKDKSNYDVPSSKRRKTLSMLSNGMRRTNGGESSSALVSTFRTKRTPVYDVRFTRKNLLLVGGSFEPVGIA